MNKGQKQKFIQGWSEGYYAEYFSRDGSVLHRDWNHMPHAEIHADRQ